MRVRIQSRPGGKRTASSGVYISRLSGVDRNGIERCAGPILARTRCRPRGGRNCRSFRRCIIRGRNQVASPPDCLVEYIQAFCAGTCTTMDFNCRSPSAFLKEALQQPSAFSASMPPRRRCGDSAWVRQTGSKHCRTRRSSDPGPVDHPADARVQDRPGTHDAGLEGDVKRATAEPVIAPTTTTRPDAPGSRVRRGIVAADRRIETAADDCSVSHHHGSNRYLAAPRAFSASVSAARMKSSSGCFNLYLQTRPEVKDEIGLGPIGRSMQIGLMAAFDFARLMDDWHG